MENCVVRNLTTDGIRFLSSASSNLAVSNTLTADNGGNGIIIGLEGGSGVTVKAVLSRVEAYNNSHFGIILFGNSAGQTVNATVADSVAAGNNLAGFGMGPINNPQLPPW